MKITKQDEIQKLFDTIKNKIEKDISADGIKPEEFISRVKQISFGNKYALWIIQRYLNNGIQRYEDFGRVETALSYFHRYKNRLEEKDRNIMNIKSLIDLENLVESFAELDKQKDLEKIQKEKIYSDTKIIYDGPEGKILIPLTQEASIFWGQGTKWCTASSKNNMFNYYNKQGPLYVFISNRKDNEGREIKFQFHAESNQFMNSEDEGIFTENRISNHEYFYFFKKLMDGFSVDEKMNFIDKMACRWKENLSSYQGILFENLNDLAGYLHQKPYLYDFISSEFELKNDEMFEQILFTTHRPKRIGYQTENSSLFELYISDMENSLVLSDLEKIDFDETLFKKLVKHSPHLSLFCYNEKLGIDCVKYFFENTNYFFENTNPQREAFWGNKVSAKKQIIEKTKYFFDLLDKNGFEDLKIKYITKIINNSDHMFELMDSFSEEEKSKVIDNLFKIHKLNFGISDIPMKIIKNGYHKYLKDEFLVYIVENKQEIKSKHNVFGGLITTSLFNCIFGKGSPEWFEHSGDTFEKEKHNWNEFKNIFEKRENDILSKVTDLKSFSLLEFFGVDQRKKIINSIIDKKKFDPNIAEQMGVLGYFFEKDECYDIGLKIFDSMLNNVYNMENPTSDRNFKNSIKMFLEENGKIICDINNNSEEIILKLSGLPYLDSFLFTQFVVSTDSDFVLKNKQYIFDCMKDINNFSVMLRSKNMRELVYEFLNTHKEYQKHVSEKNIYFFANWYAYGKFIEKNPSFLTKKHIDFLLSELENKDLKNFEKSSVYNILKELDDETIKQKIIIDLSKQGYSGIVLSLLVDVDSDAVIDVLTSDKIGSQFGINFFEKICKCEVNSNKKTIILEKIMKSKKFEELFQCNPVFFSEIAMEFLRKEHFSFFMKETINLAASNADDAFDKFQKNSFFWANLFEKEVDINQNQFFLDAYNSLDEKEQFEFTRILYSFLRETIGGIVEEKSKKYILEIKKIFDMQKKDITYQMK